jgi:membrane protein implicated in regulation of membrane protease activity
MTWATFYLGCFLVGTTLSLVSFLFGGLHLTHFHLPHFHLPHLFHGHAALPDGQAVGPGGYRGSLPVLNMGTMTVFLAWFGAAGYLLTVHSPLAALLILLFACGAGTAGAAIIFWFVVKLLLAHDRELDPADYDRVGVLARIISPVGAGGTGEIIFSQAGTRHTCGARSEDGKALARGTEVVVTRYEHGIAYVRRWEEMAEDEVKTRD